MTLIPSKKVIALGGALATLVGGFTSGAIGYANARIKWRKDQQEKEADVSEVPDEAPLL